MGGKGRRDSDGWGVGMRESSPAHYNFHVDLCSGYW